MATYLDKILAAHREGAAGRKARIDEARAVAAKPRGFRVALAQANAGLHVVAEIKRRSPSKGDLNAGLVPGVLAKSYADGGASALSVLTDHDFFGGSPNDLEEAREAATDLPVLRKDFTVCEADVADARLMGADAVLLIVAALDDAELKAFHELAAELGLDALVETHDEGEVDRALNADATLIGVNQRDLVTFHVDADRATRVAAHIPDTVVKVAESGVRTQQDAARLKRAGYHAVLVGETLVTSADPATTLKELRLCS